MKAAFYPSSLPPSILFLSPFFPQILRAHLLGGRHCASPGTMESCDLELPGDKGGVGDAARSEK